MTKPIFRIASLTAALFVASPAWAVTQGFATIYADSTGGHGGSITNSGTTDTSSATFTSGGTGVTAAVASASVASLTGITTGASTGSTTFTQNTGCTNVTAGSGVWDVTLGSAGLIGVVSSCTGAGPYTVTLTGNSVHNSSGTTDTYYVSPPVTFSGTLDIHTLAGCTLQSGSNYVCDMTQAIYLNGATNSRSGIFFIAGFNSCSGSGTCDLALGASATAGAGSAVPSGAFSGSSWAIGGRTTLPNAATSGGIESAILPGQTIKVATGITFSCATTVCFTFRTTGDNVSGPITIAGASAYPTLQTSGNTVVLVLGSNFVRVTGLTIGNSTSTDTQWLVTTSGSGPVIDNNIFVQTTGSGTGGCLGLAGTTYVLNNAFQVCNVGDAIINSSGNTVILGNYFSGTFTGQGIEFDQVNPNGTIEDNIMIGNANGSSAKDAILLAGTSTNLTGTVTLRNNVIAGWQTGGLVVSNAYSRVAMYNNIFYNNNLTSGANVTMPAIGGSSDTLASMGGHGCNDFYAASGTNLTNVVANATEITTDPLFNTVTGGVVTNAGLQATSPALHTGCYASPGGYSAASNYVNMGAFQSLAGTGGGSHIIGGGL